MKDMVNHPEHYISETGLEAIDVIEAFTFDLKGIEAVCTGNALKYLCRWKQKNGVEDLKKAKWYIERCIEHAEKLEEENRDLKPDAMAEVRKEIEDLNKKYEGSNGDPGVFRFEHLFETREEAEGILSNMQKTLSTFGCVLLADLYLLTGTVPNSCDYAHGWTDLDDCRIEERWYSGCGYQIVFPAYKNITKESDQ